jgi:hypothetical protein
MLIKMYQERALQSQYFGSKTEFERKKSELAEAIATIRKIIEDKRSEPKSRLQLFSIAISLFYPIMAINTGYGIDLRTSGETLLLENLPYLLNKEEKLLLNLESQLSRLQSNNAQVLKVKDIQLLRKKILDAIQNNEFRFEESEQQLNTLLYSPREQTSDGFFARTLAKSVSPNLQPQRPFKAR